MSRADVVAVAASQLGVVEGTYTFSDGRTVTGPNVVRYWADLSVPEAFAPAALRVGGWAWCAAFVTWCLLRSVGLDLRKQMWPYNCEIIRSWSVAHGRWRTTGYTPQPGDLTLYDFGHGIAHIGIHEAIRGANFVAIEGNTSPGNSGSQANGGGVYRRARARQHIAGWVDMSGLVGTDPAPQASKEDDEMALKILNVTPTAGAAPTAQAAMLPDGRLVTLHDPSEVAALIRVYGTGDMGTITEADRRTVSAVLARADAHN
jgi:hypothetical protein